MMITLHFCSLYNIWPIYIAVLPFLINWNEKQCNKSNILTMDQELILENSSSTAVYTLPNAIIYLTAKSIWISDWDRSIEQTWNLG